MNVTPSLNLAVDVIMVALLAATIGYAFVLNRKLSALRDAKGELENLAIEFTESTKSAESGLESLRVLAQNSGQALQSEIESARGLANELAFLIDKGNELSRRLENALATRNARNAVAAHGKPAQEPKVSPPPPQPISAEEAALVKALQGMR